jgi:predicted glycoside hydrolase/deacetylase ChbG (UPF0249 family)
VVPEKGQIPGAPRNKRDSASTALVINLKTAIFLGLGLILAPGAMAEEIRLIVRGDDLGMTQGSLIAFEKAFKEGVLTCASLLACAPWFEGGAEVCRNNSGLCPGVHLSLVGEWRDYRWRPVLPWDKVSSLVDEDGFLFRYPEELIARKPKLEEIAAEWRAQIRLAKKRVRVDYLDAHYSAYSEYPGMDNLFRKIAGESGLAVSGWMGERRVSGVYKVPVGEKRKKAEAMLERLTPGLWLWVNHPGIDSPEHNALIHTDPRDVFTGGGVGKHRAEETNVLTSREIKKVIERKGIRLTSYRDLIPVR